MGVVEPAPGSGGAAAPTAGPVDVAGDYVGDISVEGKTVRVETHLRGSGSAISGDYRYGGTPGRFSDCALAGSQLSCTWTEGGMTGHFNVQLAADGRSFSGGWDYSDGRSGGSWTGRRQGPPPGPPPVAASPPPAPPPVTPPTTPVTPTAPPTGSVAGTYQGSISVNGAPGPIVTTLTESGGVVSGNYTYGTANGQFSNCRRAGAELTCTWTEGTLTGNFRVQFAAENRYFAGTWDNAGGSPGGTWSGTRK